MKSYFIKIYFYFRSNETRRGKGSRVEEYFQRRRIQRRQQAARSKAVKGVYMNVDGLTESKIQDIQRILLREDSKSISLSI